MDGSRSDRESVTQLPTLVDSYARPTEPASSPPPAPRLSPGERIAGRYVVEALLGSGGFGEVYRVSDEVAGRDRALKLHRLGGQHALARESLKGEFAMLSAISHPNIAAVHDFGWVGSEVAYFTQDLVTGVRLDGAGIDIRSPRALAVLAQLCRALDYLHSRGILHRDVKPTNILLDPERDHLTLLDFGIARALATDDEKVAGTFGYVAPEAITGGNVDARADLYAVGVILFQLARGARPFTGDASEILRKQLLAPAPALPAGIAGPELGALVARLLEREPAQRPASARELLALLARALGGEVAIDTRDTLSSYVLSAPCVGRAAEIEVLTDHLQGGSSRPVVLSGEGGTGKSRLLREARQRLQLAGTSYLGVEAHRAAPGGVILELARAVLTPPLVARLSDDDRRELARAIPELRRRGERIVPAIDPERARRARREALVRALGARFQVAHGVIAIEDVHWASEPDRAAVVELVEQSRDAGVPCTFVLTARPGDATAELDRLSPLTVALADLTAEEARALVAATFGQADLLDDTGVGRDLDRGRRSALWLQETLRLAVETGAVSRVGGRFRVVRDVPALPLAEVLARRLAALDRDARRLAETLAVVGAPVRAVDVAELTSGTKRGFADALGELVRSGIVEDRPASGQRVYAMHDRFADTALAELSTPRRAALHRRAARWLARARDWRSVARAAHHFAEAGDHARAARAYGRAADLAHRHARPLDALDLVESQERMLEAASAPVPVALLLRRQDLALLAGLPDVAARTLDALHARSEEVDAREALEIELRSLRNTVRQERGDGLRARCADAIERARALEDRAVETELLLVAADWEFQVGSAHTGRELSLRAAGIAGEIGNDALLARAWQRAAYTAVHVGIPHESVKEADLALRAARKTGDLALQSDIARQKGNALREINDEGRALRAYGRAVDLARRGGLPELEAMAINNIGILALWLGRIDRARTALERAIELKRRVASPASLRITLSNMVAVLVASGDHEGARALLREVIPEAAPDQGPIIVCTSYANLAETYLAEGELETAGELYERSFRFGDVRGNWQTTGYPLHGWVRADVMRGGALIERARAHLPRLAELAEMFPQEQTRWHLAEAVVADAEGRLADALEACEHAYALRDTARYHWGFVGSRIEIVWLRAILLARAGKAGKARRAAESAKRQLLATARQIDDPIRRDRALTVPPIHRAIVAGDLDVAPGWTWKPAVRS